MPDKPKLDWQRGARLHESEKIKQKTRERSAGKHNKSDREIRREAASETSRDFQTAINKHNRGDSSR